MSEAELLLEVDRLRRENAGLRDTLDHYHEALTPGASDAAAVEYARRVNVLRTAAEWCIQQSGEYEVVRRLDEALEQTK